MDELYIKIVNEDKPKGDDIIDAPNGYKMKKIDDNKIVVYFPMKLQKASTSGIVNMLMEDFGSINPDMTLILNMNNHYQLFPSDPVRDNAQRIKEIESIFDMML